MAENAYLERRSQLETYFDRTAADAWAKLTSTAPVSGVRATVRAGRDEMRKTLLSWLPDNLDGRRLLDAGCGPGQLAAAAADRGADVVAVDLSRTLTDLAQRRLAENSLTAGAPAKGSIEFRVGDMLDPAHGAFDHVAAMDSLIHYRLASVVAALEKLAPRVARSIAFTIAPRTPALSIMHAVGKAFPKTDRAPAIEPIAPRRLREALASSPVLADWTIARTRRVNAGFYISEALELVRR